MYRRRRNSPWMRPEVDMMAGRKAKRRSGAAYASRYFRTLALAALLSSMSAQHSAAVRCGPSRASNRPRNRVTLTRRGQDGLCLQDLCSESATRLEVTLRRRVVKPLRLTTFSNADKMCSCAFLVDPLCWGQVTLCASGRRAHRARNGHSYIDIVAQSERE